MTARRHPIRKFASPVTRSTSPNAAYTVVDAIKDASGNFDEVIDARGISTTNVYDSRDRETSYTAADGAPIHRAAPTPIDI